MVAAPAPVRVRPLPFAAAVALGSAALAACATAQPSGGAGTAESEATARSSLFTSSDVLALRVEAPLGAAFEAAHAGEPDGMIPGLPRRVKDAFAGRLTFAGAGGASVTVPVELKVRGNSSLQECSFAKLTMKIPKDPSQPDRDLGPFAGDTKLKIGTHCGEDPTGKGRIGRLRHELATHRESAVYQLLGALLDGTADEPALHTRAARITWVDTTGGEGGGASAPLERDAFLLEAADRLAGRLGAPKHCRAVPGEDAEVCDPVLEDVEVADVEASSLDEAHVAQLATFHAMVGNWDWSLGRVGSSSGKGLWNTDVLVFAGADGAPPRLVPVAQDFDLATAVTGRLRGAVGPLDPAALEATASAALDELDAAVSPSARDAAHARALAQRAAIEATLAKAPVDAAGRASLEAHLAAFYAALARR